MKRKALQDQPSPEETVSKLAITYSSFVLLLLTRTILTKGIGQILHKTKQFGQNYVTTL